MKSTVYLEEEKKEGNSFQVLHFIPHKLAKSEGKKIWLP